MSANQTDHRPKRKCARYGLDVVHYDNAAGRLYRILSDMRALAGQRTTHDAWKLALGVEADDEVDAQIAFAGLGALVVEIVNKIKSLEGQYDPAPWLEYVPRWTVFVGTQSSKHDAHFQADAVVEPDELAALGFLSDLLHGVAPEADTESGDAKDLLEKVNTLVTDTVEATGIDADFRQFLLEHLYLIQQALQKLRIYGPDRLDEVFGRVTTDVARKQDQWPNGRQTKLWDRFKDLVGLLPLVASRTDEMAQIGENAKKLLELTSGA